MIIWRSLFATQSSDRTIFAKITEIEQNEIDKICEADGLVPSINLFGFNSSRVCKAQI